jgi:hypothetical protein
MDPAPGTSALHQELKKNRGFGLTHTARVQRTSGELFTVKELVTLVEAFTFFCWLCTETRCGPLLPVGFDSRGNAAWSRWSPTRTESFTTAETWLDRVHGGQAEALFPLFMSRFTDPYWRGVLTHAVEYLIEAGRPDTLQRAIVMTQVLLETLSYSWLTEERTIGFQDNRAAQNIRAMLKDMGISVAIPAKFEALAAMRARNGQRVTDGPHAVVTTRNAIIHRRRDRDDGYGEGESPTADQHRELIEAWLLGAWYSELAVLRLCGFEGLYHNRLSDNGHAGIVEPVPWRDAQ